MGGRDEWGAVVACFGKGSVGRRCGLSSRGISLSCDINPGRVFLAKKTSGPISGSDSLSLASSAQMTDSMESLRIRLNPGLKPAWAGLRYPWSPRSSGPISGMWWWSRLVYSLGVITGDGVLLVSGDREPVEDAEEDEEDLCILNFMFLKDLASGSLGSGERFLMLVRSSTWSLSSSLGEGMDEGEPGEPRFGDPMYPESGPWGLNLWS